MTKIKMLSILFSFIFVQMSTAQVWPVLQTVPTGSAPKLLTLNEPGYLQWVEDPRTVAPNFPNGSAVTEITKISNGAAFGLPSETFFKMAYSKSQAWNSNDSLMLVFRSNSRGVLLDGKTFQWKKNLTYVYSNGRWSNVQPTKFFNQNSSLPQLEVSDVLLDNLTVVRNFSNIGYTTSGGVGLFAGEGNQSNDDRYWPLQLGKSNGQWDMVIYDKTTNSILGTIQLPSKAGYNYIDNWGMSQSGQFFVTQSSSSWTTRDGILIPTGLNVWSRSGQYLRTKSGGTTAHQDFAIDAFGNDVLFYIAPKYQGNDKVGQTWRLDGADGNTTRDQFVDMIGWSYHISANNTLKPGWAIVTSDNHTTPSSYNWAPMWNHIFAVKLDGSGKIAPIANLHHANTPATVNNYNRMSFGGANRNLTAVVWGGTWGDQDVSGPINSYVARMKNAVVVPPPAPNAIFCNLSQAPVIDGVSESKWSSINTQTISKVVFGTVSSSTDLSADYKAMWDNTALYLLVKVKDDVLKNDSGTNTWDDDAIEIFIDGNNDKATNYDANDHQYILRLNDATVYEYHNGVTTLNPVGITFSQGANAGGYLMEIKITWAAIGVTPASGKLVGLDVFSDDDDDGAAGDGGISWFTTTPTSSSNPSAFGTIKLDGTSCSGVATGIVEEERKNLISIFPNPFSTNFTIQISSEVIIENTTMKIYDVCGKEVKVVSITDYETIIDRGELKNGIYFYQVINNNESVAKGKLICQ